MARCTGQDAVGTSSGGMAGVCASNPANVSVDANGYLHLKISKTGDTWSAAELFTTDKLGFGTYQWQTDSPTDRFDQIIVGALSVWSSRRHRPRRHERDRHQYSRWGHESGVNGGGPIIPTQARPSAELSYNLTQRRHAPATSRFVWSTSQIESSLLNGIQPVGSVTDLIKSWTYAPANSKTNIPQQAMPLGMNPMVLRKDTH